MNLGRAKLILIIAFAGLNIFLGYHLFWPDFGRLTRVAVTAEDLRNVEDMLNENNYILAASIERAVQTSDFLTVSPAIDYQKKIISRAIEKDAQLSETENTALFRSEEETLIIHSSGHIRIIYSPGQQLTETVSNLEERDLKMLAEQFLAARDLMPEGIMFDYAEKNERGASILHYYQIVDAAPVYVSQLKIRIADGGIERIDIYWLNPIDRTPARDMEVISATEALFNLAKELGRSAESRKIIDIDLGYYSGEYYAEKWDIPPVWRIVLDGQHRYYVNAFTGNLEKESVIPEQIP